MKLNSQFLAGLVAGILVLAVVACRTPVERQEAAEKKVAASDKALVREAQKEVAGVKESLTTAPKSRPVEVAKDAAARADALLAQANGPLSSEELSKRIALVQGQLSAEQAARVAAERALAVERKGADEVSSENAKLKAELAAAVEATKAWAVERDAVAKKWERLMFWVWCAVGLVGASIVLPMVASVASVVFPAAAPVLGLASKVVGYAVSPALQYAKDKAVNTIERTGKAIEELRIDLPEKAGKITRTVDSWVNDDEHQMAMGRAAERYRLKERPLEPRAS